MQDSLFHGELFGPEDPARSFAVQVKIGYDSLHLKKESGQEYQLPFSSTRLSRGGFDGLGIVVQGTNEAGQSIYLQMKDEGFLRELRDRGPATVQSLARDLMGKGTATRVWGTLSLVILVLVIVGGAFGLFYGSGFLADFVVSRIPPSVEASLGELTANSLTQGKVVLTEGPVHDGVKAVWARVLEGVEKNPYAFKLYLVDHATVNAMAAPGGHVVLFSGLLANLESGEELAGILAHECAHALRRHSLKRLAKTAGFSIAFSLFLGDLGGLTGVFTEFGKELALLSYGRDDEREADEEAVKIMVRAGIDPTRFPEFFRRMASDSGALDHALAIVSTHPSHRERDERLKALFAAHKNLTVRPIDADWKKLKASLSVTANLGRKND